MKNLEIKDKKNPIIIYFFKVHVLFLHYNTKT